MKMFRIGIAVGCISALLTMAVEADAADARARCRVKDGRARVQVDGRDLVPGTYTATVTNLNTAESAVSKAQTATPEQPDRDFDFDSTAGPADADSPISATFAEPGQTVSGAVNDASATTVASATAICTD